MSKRIKEGTLLKFYNKSEKERLEYIVVYMKDGTVKLVCKNNSYMDYTFQTVKFFEQAMDCDYEVSLGYKLEKEEITSPAPIFEGDEEGLKIEDDKTVIKKLVYEVEFKMIFEDENEKKKKIN